MEEGHNTGPGNLLATARDRLGMTRGDVAKRLFLSERFIEAIEKDCADDGTNSMFVRGYIRAYARLVEVPLDEVMLVSKPAASVKESHSAAPLVSAPMMNQSSTGTNSDASEPALTVNWGAKVQALRAAVLPLALKADPRFMMGGLAVLGMLALVSVIYLFNANPSNPETLEASVQHGFAQETTDALATVTEAGPVQPNAAEAEPGVASDPVLEQVSAASAVLKKRSSHPSVLVFSATDKSWVTTLDKNGDRIFARMVQRGESFELEGESPFKIIVGNPQAVRLAYNGDPIPLSTIDKTNVMITLGATAKDMTVAYLDDENNQSKQPSSKKKTR